MFPPTKQYTVVFYGLIFLLHKARDGPVLSMREHGKVGTRGYLRTQQLRQNLSLTDFRSAFNFVIVPYAVVAVKLMGQSRNDFKPSQPGCAHLVKSNQGADANLFNKSVRCFLVID